MKRLFTLLILAMTSSAAFAQGYSNSYEVNFYETLRHPICNTLRGKQMEIIKGWMDRDPEIRLKYSDYFFSLSNVQELYSGEVDCLGRFDVVEKKEVIEKELQEWIEASPERKERWGKWGFGPDNSFMYVNFLTDNDITGGNSGSPVLNSRGELIGLAFDGNKESLSSDVWCEDGYNKCVCVDIRFVLWTLDRYAGMTRIIEELDI